MRTHPRPARRISWRRSSRYGTYAQSTLSLFLSYLRHHRAFLQTFELPAEPEVLLARGLAKGGLAETEGLLSADGEDGDL